MIFASVKNAARAARRLHLAIAEGGRFSIDGGVKIRRSEACHMIARSLGYRDHHHLVNAFGTIDAHPNDVAARLVEETRKVGGHLSISDIVDEVIPTVREGAPSTVSLDWTYRREFIDLQQNEAFERELAAVVPGTALLLTGRSYTGKSRIAERYAVHMGRNRHQAIADEVGMSFSAGTCYSDAALADNILCSLIDDYDFKGPVAAKTAELRRRILAMPPRVIAIDDFDSIGIRKGKRSLAALDMVASLVADSHHRWILIGTDSSQNGGADGVEEVIDRSPALRKLICATVDLPCHHADDADVEKVMKAWERSLPIPCKGFFDHADHRQEFMSVIGAPVSIGIVMNGLRDLGNAIRKTPSPSKADVLALIAKMRENRIKYERQTKEWEAELATRVKPAVRRHALIAVPHLLSIEPGEREYDHHAEGPRWETQAEGTRFTCRIDRDFNHGGHSLCIDAIDLMTEDQTADITVKEGVVTLGVGTGVNALHVEFDPDMLPGWEEHGDRKNHMALNAALKPMFKERRMPAEVRTELRHLIRIIRDATGAEGAGFETATLVKRQRLFCQMRIAQKVDVDVIAALMESDYPIAAWHYGGMHRGGIVADGVSFWQRKPEAQSSRRSIEDRIRRNLPGCSEKLREAILDLHTAAKELVPLTD